VEPIKSILLFLFAIFMSNAQAPGRKPVASVPAKLAALEERFVVHAQYRGAVKKAFKNIGKGRIQSRPGSEGRFGLSLHACLRHPETQEIFKIKVSGDYALKGRSIGQPQGLKMSAQAEKYAPFFTKSLPFFFLARFQNIPSDTDIEEIPYRFGDQEYLLRYVPTTGTIEVTLEDRGSLVGKFFLDGQSGYPPRRLTKVRVVGPENTVFTLELGPTETLDIPGCP
jgi:hypothetical protein